METLKRAQQEAADCGLTLAQTDDGLALEGDGMVLRVDFRELIPRLQQGKLQRELLVRAAKLKHAGINAKVGPLRAFDATAGLGEDSLLLAAAGFHVTLCERNCVVAALLEDALARAATDERLAPIVQRMSFVAENSIEVLRCAPQSFDVIYLDPMFPARQKSAAVKKKFQLLHRLERPCDDAEALLRAAHDAHPRKIVVKRPPKGPYLADVKPSYSLSSKAVRFDVIALA